MTTVHPSRLQRGGLFGFLTIAVGLALVRGLVGAETTAGRVAIAVIFGGILALILAGWIRLARRVDRLEISAETIRYTSASGKETHLLSRANGLELRFVAKGAGRFSFLALQQVQTGTVVPLHLFARGPIEAACEQNGWDVQ